MAESNKLSLVEFWKAIAIATAIVAVFATIFVWSGFYNVSAQKPHFEVTTWLLAQIRRQSIQYQSNSVPPAPDNLDDAELVTLGAVQYQLGCAACHKAPGWTGSRVGDAMLPAPPPLTWVSEKWSPRELFWIVRNGQKYTGMPAWIAYEREDEVWPLVAFLERLPSLGPDEYRRLTSDRSSTPGFSLSTGRAVIEVCARCHGLPGEPPRSNLVPFLSAQSASYLRRSLEEYQSGTRPSGYMELVASGLDDTTMDALTEVYAAAPPPAPAGEASEDVSRGAKIFSAGLPGQNVPSCAACHTAANPQFPQLAGQTTVFLSTQLQVFRKGIRNGSGYGRIMTTIAERMTDADIDAVSAYLSTLPPGMFGTGSESAP
ncbi:c-type cytochrome [Aquibium oceanicum]|uniref:Cytochrome c domain-containing protein n=1 Tax=Aquibium oceanicum TaxID=1670800 RepID=A0A1L3T002_9HYPH|nr:c-type cytochrome [Aquibium oceanicum]APH74941.1 hypothetical protein BSQ44_26010 [Aquibium oceanicum]